MLGAAVAGDKNLCSGDLFQMDILVKTGVLFFSDETMSREASKMFKVTFCGHHLVSRASPWDHVCFSFSLYCLQNIDSFQNLAICSLDTRQSHSSHIFIFHPSSACSCLTWHLQRWIQPRHGPLNAHNLKGSHTQAPDWVASIWQRRVWSTDHCIHDGVTEDVIPGVRGLFVEMSWSWKSNKELAREKGAQGGEGHSFQVEGVLWTKPSNCLGELQIYWLDL